MTEKEQADAAFEALAGDQNMIDGTERSQSEFDQGLGDQVFEMPPGIEEAAHQFGAQLSPELRKQMAEIGRQALAGGMFNNGITSGFSPLLSSQPVPPMPGDAFGSEKFGLSDGRTMSINNAIWSSLRSAFVLSRETTDRQWDLFGYSRHETAPGATEPSRAHTNIPRSGDVGLPRDWEMIVCRWRASINIPFVESVLDWAAETSVELVYNDKCCANETLADLLLSGATISGPGDDYPVHMREHLSYRVALRTDSESALRGLRDYLRGDVADEKLRVAIAELGVLARMTKDSAIGDAIQHVINRLNPSKSLTCWVHLEGALKRTVV